MIYLKLIKSLLNKLKNWFRLIANKRSKIYYIKPEPEETNNNTESTTNDDVYYECVLNDSYEVTPDIVDYIFEETESVEEPIHETTNENIEVEPKPFEETENTTAEILNETYSNDDSDNVLEPDLCGCDEVHDGDLKYYGVDLLLTAGHDRKNALNFKYTPISDMTYRLCYASDDELVKIGAYERDSDGNAVPLHSDDGRFIKSFNTYIHALCKATVKCVQGTWNNIMTFMKTNRVTKEFVIYDATGTPVVNHNNISLVNA